MKQYTGKCVGGPLDGQSLVHWSNRKNLISPFIPFSTTVHGDTSIKALTIGEYRLNDFGTWFWWETDAGKALKVLGEEND